MYASGRLLRETYGSNTLDFFYSTSGQPYALKHNGTVYYYITNLQGDVMQIVNGDGAAVASYEYDPYGNIISATGELAEINPLRYRGYIYDSECNLYYLQSRYYDPSIGRFLNPDSYPSTGQGILGNNMFAYCINNPVCRIDESGMYSRKDAVEYAEEWYDGENEEYYYYSDGDCANFVSQCLRAGGVKDSSGWYHKKHKKGLLEIAINPLAWFMNKFKYNWNSSETWRKANEQYCYFSDPKNGYINGNVIKISSALDIAVVAASGEVQPGDLLYFCSDGETVSHATMVSKVENGMIYYTAHSRSRFDSPLRDTLGESTVLIVRIRDDA